MPPNPLPLVALLAKVGPAVAELSVFALAWPTHPPCQIADRRLCLRPAHLIACLSDGLRGVRVKRMNAASRVSQTPSFRSAHDRNSPREVVRIDVDGEEVRAYKGETIAAALSAEGRRVLRHTTRRGQPRGLFCGMGICFDCVVVVDGQPGVRACRTLVADGMRVRIQRA